MGAVASVAGSVLGGVGNAVTGFLGADAANRAAKNQVSAIDKIKKFTTEQMDPALVNKQAQEADETRAKSRLALQEKIDPALAEQRKQSEALISKQLSEIGVSDSDRIAALAAKEGAAGIPGMDAVKKKLLDSAMAELNAGATLPPDLQAELVQAGLQQSGAVTGGARSGVSSSILSRVLGKAGVDLQQQRELQAAQLATTAGTLEQQRQSILQTLFPNLQNQQLKNLSAASGVLQQSNQMLPESGLSGSDVANVWLSRVGALNQLSSQKANVAAQGALATGTAKAGAWGSIASLGQAAVPGISSFFTPTPATNPGIGASGRFAA